MAFTHRLAARPWMLAPSMGGTVVSLITIAHLLCIRVVCKLKRLELALTITVFVISIGYVATIF